MSGWSPPPNGPGRPGRSGGSGPANGGWGPPPEQAPHRQPQPGPPPAQPGPQPGGPVPGAHGPPGWGASPPGFPYPPPSGPGQQPRKRHVGLVIGLIGGGTTLVLALIVGIVVVVTQPASHTLSTPTAAGGLNRDQAAEQRISSIERMKRSIRRSAKGDIDRVVTAVYGQPGQDAISSSGQGVLFVGIKADGLNADELIKNFMTSAQQEGGNATTVNPPSGFDGKAACGEIQTGTGRPAALCTWADNDTLGQFIPISAARPMNQMEDLMNQMRPDLEKEE